MADLTKSMYQRESIVVVYTKIQANVLMEYMISLQKSGKQAVPVYCEGRECLVTINSALYSSIYVLACESLCTTLMENYVLHQDVLAKFKEFEESNKIIHVVNICIPGNEEFSELFYQIPRQTRRLIEGDKFSGNVPSQNKPFQDTNGMAGGRADRSNVAGAAHAGRDINIGCTILQVREIYDVGKDDQGLQLNNAKAYKRYFVLTDNTTAVKPGTVQMIVTFTEEMTKEDISDIASKMWKSEGVKEVDLTKGSLIITLTLERDYIVTEEWKRTILRSLFSSNLGICISEGKTCSVTIQRYMVYEDDMYTSLLSHNGVVAKTEVHSETELLKFEISKLEEELERIHMADAKWMLLMKRNTSTGDDTTSGFYSAAGSTEDSDTGRGKSTEDVTSPGPLNWDIEEGDTKIMFTNNNDMLNEACRSGKVEIAKGILSSGRANINNKSETGWTPVLIAVWKGYKRLFDVLVMAGCDVSVKLDNGNNILHLACFGGNVDIVNYIILNKLVDIESKGRYGRTAVMKAVEVDQKKVFDLLVSHGCNLSCVDDDGNNILHCACIGGSVDIVKYILADNIAGIESKGQLGRTPVMTATAMGQKRVFDLLVSKGCHLSGVDDTRYNILHLACFSDSVEIVQYILTHNIAGVDSKGQHGRTPVMCAAEKGQKRVFDFMVSRGCNLSGVGNDGYNILHLAAIGGNVGIVKHILTDLTVDINSRVQGYWTPLKLARVEKHGSVIKFLIERGAVDT